MASSILAGAGRIVGAKTHLAILHAIDALEPKPPEKCTICDIVRIAPVDDLAANEVERAGLRCLREFLADALSGKEFDDRYWTYPFETYLGQVVPCSFIGQKNTVGISFKDKKTKRAVQGTCRRHGVRLACLPGVRHSHSRLSKNALDIGP